jgi:hypothetical protein
MRSLYFFGVISGSGAWLGFTFRPADGYRFCFDGVGLRLGVIITFAQQGVNDNKDDDGGQAAAAQFFCAPGSNDPAEKIIHRYGWLFLVPFLILLSGVRVTGLGYCCLLYFNN